MQLFPLALLPLFRLSLVVHVQELEASLTSGWPWLPPLLFPIDHAKPLDSSGALQRHLRICLCQSPLASLTEGEDCCSWSQSNLGFPHSTYRYDDDYHWFICLVLWVSNHASWKSLLRLFFHRYLDLHRRLFQQWWKIIFLRAFQRWLARSLSLVLLGLVFQAFLFSIHFLSPWVALLLVTYFLLLQHQSTALVRSRSGECRGPQRVVWCVPQAACITYHSTRLLAIYGVV